ncbi:MAG: hypothetical protein WB919_18855 [Candidatus Sulfotelmatobacter sp.]
MKAKRIIIAAFFLLTPVSLFAAPGLCVKGTLANYIALGSTGCTFEDSVFSNFAYELPPAPAASVSPEQITVTPVPGPIIVGFFLGLNFSANWAAGAGELSDTVIAYTVTPRPPVSTTSPGTITLDLGQIQILGLSGGVTVTQETNPGNLSVFEICTNGACALDGTDQLTFAPVTTLQVTNVLTLNGGSGGVLLQLFAANYNLCSTCAQPGVARVK